MVTIKKYKNRKLYNTMASRYVTLDELVALLRDGQEVEVRDQATGADVTSHTLAMALAKKEEEYPTELAKQRLVEILRQRPVMQAQPQSPSPPEKA